MSEGNAKLKTTKKGKPMYNDNELIKCPKCEGLGLYASDYYGNSVFHHKTKSEKNEGYFSFVINCQN